MRFEWDDRKAETNLQKHRISFEVACLVFDDPHRMTGPDPHLDGDRWQTIGAIGTLTTVVVFVVHAEIEDEVGDEVRRIISARKATPSERKRYGEGI
jgi:uncharacterized DUF497 family protein